MTRAQLLARLTAEQPDELASLAEHLRSLRRDDNAAAVVALLDEAAERSRLVVLRGGAS